MSEAAESIVPEPEPPSIQVVDPVAETPGGHRRQQASIVELLLEAGRDCALLLEPETYPG